MRRFANDVPNWTKIARSSDQLSHAIMTGFISSLRSAALGGAVSGSGWDVPAGGGKASQPAGFFRHVENHDGKRRQMARDFLVRGPHRQEPRPGPGAHGGVARYDHGTRGRRRKDFQNASCNGKIKLYGKHHDTCRVSRTQA